MVKRNTFIKDGTDTVHLAAYPAYMTDVNSETLYESSYAEYAIVKTDFKKRILELERLLQLKQTLTEFRDLRFLVQLKEDKLVAISIETFSAKGLFAFVNEEVGAKVGTVVVGGKEVPDYKALLRNKPFMKKLMERLETLHGGIVDTKVWFTKSMKVQEWETDRLANPMITV